MAFWTRACPLAGAGHDIWDEWVGMGWHDALLTYGQVLFLDFLFWPARARWEAPDI